MENKEIIMDMVLLFQQLENGDGPQHVHLFQVHMDGVEDISMMEQILQDADTDQISLLLKQELLKYQ